MSDSKPPAAVGVPDAFEALAEHQRQIDISNAEMRWIKHRARGPLAEGHPILCVHTQPSWPTVKAWFLRHTNASDPRVGEVMATVLRVTFLRQSATVKPGEVADAWHIEAANERGVIYRDVVPTDRFYASWQEPPPPAAGSSKT